MQLPPLGLHATAARAEVIAVTLASLDPHEDLIVCGGHLGCSRQVLQ